MDALPFIASLIASLAWPIVAVAIALLFRGPIKTALEALRDQRLKRLKAGVFEAEWYDAEARSTVEIAKSPEALEARAPDRKLLTERLRDLAERSPREAVLMAYAEFQEALKRRLTLVGYTEPAEHLMSAWTLAAEAQRRGLISPEAQEAVEAATYMRNLAAHAPNPAAITPEMALNFLSIADSILYAVQRGGDPADSE